MCNQNESCNCNCNQRLATNAGMPLASRLVRREGKYVIAPGIMAIAGVLNGALLPREELPASVPLWDKVPIVLQHPRKDGEFVPASTPGADTRQIGFVSNVSLDGDKLRAEYWFDTEQIANIEEAAGLIASVEAGQMIEQSTGYMYDFVANSAGTWKGRPYTVTQRNIKPDHVAVLPKGIGACSIADGCGVLQVNEATVKAPPTDSVMVAFFLEGADAVKYALSPADLPDGSEVVTPEELHVTLAYLGKVDEQKINEHDLMSRMADIARHEVFMPADVQGLGRFAAKDGKSLEPVYLSIGSAALHDFRERITSYLGDAMPAQTNGFLPHVTLAYVPQGIGAGIPMPTRETIFFHSIAVAWGGRVSVFKLQGEQRESIALSTNEKEILMDTEVTTPVTPAAEVVPTVPVVPAVEPVLAVNEANELRELLAAVKAAGGMANLTASLNDFAVNQKAERTTLIAQLAANERVGLTAADLELLPTASLQRVYRANAPTDFGGRFGFASNEKGDEWEPYLMPAEEKK